MIKIYTREFCPNCEDLKEILDRGKIEYTDYNVDYFKNKAKLVVRGFKELPVIDVSNKWKEFDNIASMLSFISDSNDS